MFGRIDSSAEGLCVRFSMAMRCAERPGMFTMLWQHEFYMVMEVTYGEYVYQALEFKVGSSLPPDELIGSTTMKRMVCGYAAGPMLRPCMLGNLINWKRGKGICSIRSRTKQMGT